MLTVYVYISTYLHISIIFIKQIYVCIYTLFEWFVDIQHAQVAVPRWLFLIPSPTLSLWQIGGRHIPRWPWSIQVFKLNHPMDPTSRLPFPLSSGQRCSTLTGAATTTGTGMNSSSWAAPAVTGVLSKDPERRTSQILQVNDRIHKQV